MENKEGTCIRTDIKEETGSELSTFSERGCRIAEAASDCNQYKIQKEVYLNIPAEATPVSGKKEKEFKPG